MDVNRRESCDVVVIGGGIAGLTAGALLAQAQAKVIVVERHNIVGGCASFFQDRGFRFDVGATVAGGFGPRGLHRRIFGKLGTPVEVQPLEPSMVVHIDDHRIIRWGDTRWEAERLQHFGSAAETFWKVQERIADRAWILAEDAPSLPVDIQGIRQTLGALKLEDLRLLGILGRNVASIMPNIPLLRRYVDAQLLITAQTDADGADLLYGATALDLAREGVFHLPAGLSSIATALAKALRTHGGQIYYRSIAQKIHLDPRGCVREVELSDGRQISCSKIISAIPIDETNALLPAGNKIPTRATQGNDPRWGAFMAYVGLPANIVPEDFVLHHQMLNDEHAPLGEGNSLFFSFSAENEKQRSRTGGRAVTISTHTAVDRWQRAWEQGRYEQERDALGARLLSGLERLLPGATQAAEVISFATPHTFARYTGRNLGRVGGLPQAPWFANLRAQSHRSGIAGLFLCGDAIFPGQSTVGVSHSALVAARRCAAISL